MEYYAPPIKSQVLRCKCGLLVLPFSQTVDMFQRRTSPQTPWSTPSRWEGGSRLLILLVLHPGIKNDNNYPMIRIIDV